MTALWHRERRKLSLVLVSAERVPLRSAPAGDFVKIRPRTQATVADSGIIDAGDEGVVLDDNKGGDGPEWVSPFPEVDRYAEPTGERFVRCPECGVEVLDDDTATVSHLLAYRFA